MIHRREDETHPADRQAAAKALVGSASPRPPLYAAVADPGSIERFGEQIEADDPAQWPGYPVQLRRARALAGASHAVTTGIATVGGRECVLIGFEFPFLGGSVGETEGAKIAAAFGLAITHGLPVVSVAASGGMRMQEGSSALVQMHAIAAAIAAARRAGIPHVAVAGNPTTGGMWASLVASADVIIGVAGAQVSFSGSRTRPESADPAAAEFRAEGQHAGGFLDLVVPADRLRDEVAAVLRLLSPRTRGAAPGSAPLSDAAEPARHGLRLGAGQPRPRRYRRARRGVARGLLRQPVRDPGRSCRGNRSRLALWLRVTPRRHARVYRAERPAHHRGRLPHGGQAAHARGAVRMPGADADRHARRG